MFGMHTAKYSARLIISKFLNVRWMNEYVVSKEK